ncbi:MAG: TauD/TfdA family dioxygenase, partial [Gammaproteobacteria bacterium]|nr:TauD/TfdA family dioxygenase [Gammaproteobacteria bacterium]
MQAAPLADDNYDICVEPLTGAVGCEIRGIDVANLTADEFAQVYQAFLEYCVVLLHDQELTQEQFGEFGKRFGKLEDEPFLPTKTDVPGVYYFRGAPANAKSLSTQKLGWHADHTYLPNPTKAAMLYAVDVPPAGGDTLFANSYLAYEALSPAMQAFLEDKVAEHDVLWYGLKSG